jgi:hypothetical protein
MKYYFGTISNVSWTMELELLHATTFQEASKEFHKRLSETFKKPNYWKKGKSIYWLHYRRACLIARSDYNLRTRHGTVQYFLMDEKQAYYLNKATGIPKGPYKKKNYNDVNSSYEISGDDSGNCSEDETIENMLDALGDFEDWDTDYQETYGDSYRNYKRKWDDD